MKSFQSQTHYEVLEISVGASQAEIRYAHERLAHLYADDQAALYGLVDPSHAAALRVRLKEALEVLADDELRELYDEEIGLPPRVPKAAPPAPRVSPPRLVIAPPISPPITLSPAGEREARASGWGGSIAWVTPTVAAQPVYTYAVIPTKPVAAPSPVLVVPVPARILATPTGAPPETLPPAEPAPAVEPSQLALDVSPGVPSWGGKAIERVRREPEAAEPPPPLPPPPPEPEPVGEAAPPPEPEKPAPPPDEPPIPVLSDDVQVAIVPARASPNREFRVEQRPRPYEIPEGVEINGDLLKQVRLAKGLSLVQVADRTRIGVKHLENVEGDRYDALPAAVYLRGILMNLARELGLDGLRVSKSYLTFVEAHRSKG